ncbi:MAG: tRNA pseudouridine(55) synthase, partial [Bacteroidales bacterium]|nr:tRNA pseudouridine(55) synthase [Bacteroidales bacterium]
LELLEHNLDNERADNHEGPFIKIRVVCSKGTYIRALARDIGQALGSGAHLTALVRTRVGEVSLDDCRLIGEFKKELEEQLIQNI